MCERMMYVGWVAYPKRKQNMNHLVNTIMYTYIRMLNCYVEFATWANVSLFLFLLFIIKYIIHCLNKTKTILNRLNVWGDIFDIDTSNIWFIVSIYGQNLPFNSSFFSLLFRVSFEKHVKQKVLH